MDEIYRARLSGSPPHAPAPLPPAAEPRFNILPHPPHPPGGPNPGPGPIPIQLPNIYVNPFPPRPPSPHVPPMAPPSMPPNIPSTVLPAGGVVKKPWWKVGKPHPLLWVSLAISLLALILEVPKGTLPTITKRHQALRAHEKQVQERLQLLSKLSTFLPPPLASIVMQPNGENALADGSLSLFTPDALRFWSSHQTTGVGKEGSWWSVEDLGSGAQVVRSRGNGGEREVWVVSAGREAEGDKTKPLLNALTHSLHLRDRLLAELTALKTASSSPTPTPSITQSSPRMAIAEHIAADDEEKRKDRIEEWGRQEERRRREKERERDIEEREMEVARREKWVVEEMRKLSDKVHSQTTELTLEDRITERLKAYQRQLAHLGQEQHSDPPVSV